MAQLMVVETVADCAGAAAVSGASRTAVVFVARRRTVKVTRRGRDRR
ncbi:hypothetical protein [Spongiactinospora gelatinilytica]|nr:hypothetical protein [Spongiactinospora gelatinilytica]